MESIWSASCELPSFEQLKGDIKTDVLVIGGGIAGVLCAEQLTKSGIDCIVAEAGRICDAVTRNTTAKITSQHGLIYDRLLREFGAEKARLYYLANEAALSKYRELCADIDCDFEQKDNYVYSLNDERELIHELNALDRIGASAQFEQKLPLPFETAGAVKFANQAQFNPLKFIAAVARGLQICENTAVRELNGNRAVTDCGNITAKSIIVATHFPFINKHGGYFIKMYQHRSYAIAVENGEDYGGMYVDSSKKGLSFRNYGDCLIIGGGSHRTGKKGGSYRELEELASGYYPDLPIKYRWATQDCMTLDGVPYIGRYSAGTKGLYAATGFNKWGMTSSMVAATLLCDMIMGRHSEYESVFSPSRTVLRPQLAVNAFESAVNLLTPGTKRCPHLGCSLKWNAAEHSWDCPCHGSRFTADGKLIDNPATGGLDCR